MRMTKQTAYLSALLLFAGAAYASGEAQKRWERMNQIRQEKFDLILPEVMRENGVEMWITVNREGYEDPLTEDFGRGYVGSWGYYVFTDRGGDRIERAALGIGTYLVEENGAYDIVTGDFDLGANDLQNFPELSDPGSFYDVSTGELEVEYRVTSNITESAYDLTVDFYLADPTGIQPQRWLGADVYPAAEANLQRTVRFIPTIEPPVDAMIVATATDRGARTSEVSAPVPVPEPELALSLLVGALGLGVAGRRSRRAAAVTREDG